jgi:SAM-dependent methyltransferase
MSSVFDEQVDHYDAWYDEPSGRAAFAGEIDALRPLIADLPHPWLEVGIGTGRVAAALGVGYGIDPALAALRRARQRGAHVAAALGEALPFSDACFGAVLIVLTLCFVDDPARVLREARRVLRRGGGVIIGDLLLEGPWGKHYAELGAQGHAYYRHAHFFSRPELTELLAGAGLRSVRTRSALPWLPDQPYTATEAWEGDALEAGFTALLAVPDEP